MIKQLVRLSDKALVTPKAFVKEVVSGSEAPVYDWQSQKNTVCAGTFYQTCAAPFEKWETD